MKIRSRFVLALVLPVLFAGGAKAQTDAWKNTAELYFLGAGMSGTTQIGPLEAPVNLSFSEILSNLEFGAMARYRGESPKFAVTADVLYSGLGATKDGANGNLSAKVSADEWIVTVTANYRVSEIADVFAGARYTSIADTLTLTPVTGNVRTAKLSEGWVDPIVGAMVKAPIGKGWSLEGYGDIGALGGSDLTWMLQGRVNWQISRVVGAAIGYRVLYQDYSTGSGPDYFLWKVTTQGPIAALNVSF